MKYTLVAGYWAAKNEREKAEFFETWFSNIVQTTKSRPPSDLFIINAKSECYPKITSGKWINLNFNLGHVHDMDKETHGRLLGGWSMSFLMACFLAYSNNTDLIYWEQDLLGFGPIIEQLYKDAEDQGVSAIVGRPQDSDHQGCEQSLMLVKNNLLLPFVHNYLGNQTKDGGSCFQRPEQKFVDLMSNELKGCVGTASFGFGRSRPQNFDEAGPWYVQKVTPSELSELKKKGLIYVSH